MYIYKYMYIYNIYIYIYMYIYIYIYIYIDIERKKSFITLINLLKRREIFVILNKLCVFFFICF